MRVRLNVNLEAFLGGLLLGRSRKLLHAQRALRLLQKSEHVASLMNEPVDRNGILRLDRLQDGCRPARYTATAPAFFNAEAAPGMDA